MHSKLTEIALCVLTFSLASACTQAQRVVRFQAPERHEDPVDTLAKTLAANGHTPASVDRDGGIVHTEWQDTGFAYGEIQKERATIHRRYTAVVSRGSAASNVVLRMDTKRCSPPRATVVATTTQTTEAQPAGASFRVGPGGFSLSAGEARPASTTTVAQVQSAPACEPMDGLIEQHQKDLDLLGDEVRAAFGEPSAG